jgi:hypothetical protein
MSPPKITKVITFRTGLHLHVNQGYISIWKKLSIEISEFVWNFLEFYDLRKSLKIEFLSSNPAKWWKITALMCLI